MVPRRTLLGSLALLAVLGALVVVQARWLRDLESARHAEISRLLETGALQIANALDEAIAARSAGAAPETAPGAPSEGAGGEPPAPVVPADVVERAVRDTLGPNAFDTYRVEIVSVEDDAAVLYRSHPEEQRREGAPAASAPVLRQPNRWVAFLGSETESAAPTWREVPLPPGPGPERWRLTLHHRDGPLVEVVARGRRRNLLVGGGLLALLVAGGVALLVAQHRARRLAEKELLFVAGVSHELRTPLTVIRTAASNLERGIVDDPERVCEYGAMIEREAARVTERVNRALRFADGERAPACEDVDPAALVEEAVASCRHWTDRRAYRIERRLAEDLPPLRGDRAALVSALGNLLDNAIKYGPDGQTVRVSARRADATTLAFDVADEGAGIPEADRGRIFAPFFRSAAAHASGETGAGLGLAVATQIAREHHGELVLEGSGAGARFSLRVPVAEASE